MPSTPVKRPMRSTSFHHAASFVAANQLRTGNPGITRSDSETPTNKSVLPTDRAPNQHRLELRLIWLDAITRCDHRLRLSQPSVVIVVDRHQWRALRHTVADAAVKFKRDAIIDRAFLRFAPATQNRQRQPQLLALDALDKSIAGCDDVHSRSCGWQPLRFIDDARI